MKKTRKINRIIKRMKENYSFILLLLLFVFLFFFKTNNSKIIYIGTNYLFMIIYAIVFIIVFIIITFIIKKKSKNFIEPIIISLFIGYVGGLIIMFPINMYNLNWSLNNYESDNYNFALVGISKRRMNRGFYFEWKNDIYFVRGYRKIFNEIEEANNLEDYYVKVELRKGILNSYIINNLEIKQK